MFYSSTDVFQYCEEKDIEISAVPVEVRAFHVFTICVYRGASGYFGQFLRLLNLTLYKPKTEFLLCGNIHVDYLLDIGWKNKYHHS